MTYIRGISSDVNDNMKQKDILEFNAQFEQYANRKDKANIYEENAISIQDFATLCNLVRDWNRRNLSDIIEINVNQKAGVSTNIKKYLPNPKNPEEAEAKIEEFIANLVNAEKYYFIFKADNIKYENHGRISYISMDMKRK